MNSNYKIGIITFKFAHNYGAMLQAYALAKAINKLGYNCEVIDYRFYYIDNWSRVKRLNDLFFESGFFVGSLRFLKRVISGYYVKKTSHNKFDYFERKIMPHSSRIYRKKDDLNYMPYNVIIFGSDQIWNSSLTNGIATEFLGDFKRYSTTKIISYAASCGTNDFQSDSKIIYSKLISTFNSVSVREYDFMETLVNRGINAKLVIDPTFLLSKNEWMSIIPKKNNYINNKYLLVYAFDIDDKVYEIAKKYAINKGLDIISIAYTNSPSIEGVRVLTDCGPLDFLSLFANAEHVITSSFHGTAFSIIFHKSFHCVPHPKYRSRTDSLLKILSLGDNTLTEFDKISDVDIDWVSVDNKLEEIINYSKSFLIESIESV